MRIGPRGTAHHEHQPSRSFPCRASSQFSIWQEMQYRFTTVCAYWTARGRASSASAGLRFPYSKFSQCRCGKQYMQFRYTRVCAYWTTRGRESSASAGSNFACPVIRQSSILSRFNSMCVWDHQGPRISSITGVKPPQFCFTLFDLASTPVLVDESMGVLNHPGPRVISISRAEVSMQYILTVLSLASNSVPVHESMHWTTGGRASSASAESNGFFKGCP